MRHTQRFQFGVFEFCPESGELLHRGRKVRVQNQVSRLLGILLERAGSLVSRAEIQTLLWPDDTFVDFDTGLNKAVCALRTALHDRASKPKFIETLPRKGYRLIGAVEAAGTSSVSDRMGPGSIWKFGSLAVLPLADYSENLTEEYFSDGMTEELIAAISRIHSLRVISRTSVMRFKRSTLSLPAIARELGVEAVVEGSVARSDGRVRITAQLILASEDRHIWSARFDREMRDLLNLQAEIAQDVASQIDRIIGSGRAFPIGSVPPEAMGAHHQLTYCRGEMAPASRAVAPRQSERRSTPTVALADGDIPTGEPRTHNGTELVIGLGPPYREETAGPLHHVVLSGAERSSD